jgi:hypothetical protein
VHGLLLTQCVQEVGDGDGQRRQGDRTGQRLREAEAGKVDTDQVVVGREEPLLLAPVLQAAADPVQQQDRR